MGNVLVGTASWTDRTLLQSGWYPPDVRTAAQRLAYYASQFRLVEVDSTYYSLPAERTAELWAQRTPPGFTFDIKAFRLLTHHPTQPSALPEDLRPQAEQAAEQKNLYLRGTDPCIVDATWDRFLSALRPLRDANKLGAILLQFPRWFPINRGNKQYIVDCQRRCDPIRVSIEFRNHTWMSPDNREETLEFLSRHNLTYVCVDMPQGSSDSVPPVLAATSDLAVIRFHGHSAKWTSNEIHERFGYLYGEQELAEWAPKIRVLAEDTDTTHVVMNNCYSDYAQTNARQLLDRITTSTRGRTRR
jgi:uncharacterized protein YecE (DUF72 family)